MNEHTDGDPLAELAALRQRLDKLEAEHSEFQRNASRRPVVPRKFLLTALPVVLLLTAVGVLYAVDALFIEQNGNTTFSGNVAIGTGSLTARTVNVATIKGTQDGKVKVEGDLEVTGKVNNNLYLQGGVENLRLLWGTVENGQKKDGLGFTASNKEVPGAVGLYFISFGAESFKSMPAASVTAFNKTYGEGHNATILRLDRGGMWVQTKNTNGQAEEGQFSFLVIGPR